MKTKAPDTESIYLSIVENTSDIIIRFDNDMRFLYLNKSGLKVVNLNKEQLYGKTHRQTGFFGKDECDYWEANIRYVLNTGKPLQGLQKSQISNEVSWYDWRLTPEYDSSGTIISVLSVSRDVTSQKAMEGALVESEKRLIKAEKVAGFGNWAIIPDQQKVIASEGAQKIYGIEGLDLNLHEIQQIPLPEYRKLLDEALSGLINNGKPYNLEFKIKRYSDGKILDILSIADYDLINKTVFGVIIDITERKKVESTLRETEEIFHHFMLHSPVYLFFKDSETRSLRLSKNFEQMLGRPLDELLGKTMDEIFPSEFAKKMISDDKRIFNGGSVEVLEEELGGRIYSTTKFPISLEGKPKYLAGYTIDVTDQRKSERDLRLQAEELRLSEEKFKNVFEYAPVGKSLTSIEGKVRVNKAFCQMLGYSKSEMKNIHWKSFTHPDDIKKNEDLTDSILRGERRTARWEKRYLSKNNEIVWVDISTTLLKDNNGVPLFFVSTVVDITEKKRAEEKIIQLNAELEKRVGERTSQLESANKELEAFAYSVSHDLRAPLRAIDGFSKFVLEDYGSKLDSEGARLLGLIRSNTQKMDTLITDILSLSRVSRSEHKVIRVDMKQIVISMLNEVASAEIQAKFKITIDPMPEAYADPVYIKQVWINLISNAIKFSSLKSEPEVKIGGYIENEIIIYYICDNGAGFNQEYAHKLFGVFQRLHKADEFEGSGVGLAIVQRIIQRHNGRVWAEGSEGNGATFYFSVPVIN